MEAVREKASRRRWTKDEKKALVKETVKRGVTATSRKYGIAVRLLFSWKQQLAGDAPRCITCNQVIRQKAGNQKCE